MIRPLLISARSEGRVLEQPVIVLQADELLRPPVSVPVEDAVPGRLAHRQGDEDREQEQRGRQEDGERRPAVERHAPARLDIRRRCDRLAGVRRGEAVLRRVGRGESDLVHPSQGRLLLVGRVLNRGRRGLGRHLPGGDRNRHVVDDAADRGSEILVEEVLMIGGLGQIVGDLFDQRILDMRPRCPCRPGYRRRSPRPPWRISPG